MSQMRKITVSVPTDLLASARAVSGKGVTETVRQALEQMLHHAWSQRMLNLRGKLQPDIDLSELGQGRELDKHGNVVD